MIAWWFSIVFCKRLPGRVSMFSSTKVEPSAPQLATHQPHQHQGAPRVSPPDHWSFARNLWGRALPRRWCSQHHQKGQMWLPQCVTRRPRPSHHGQPTLPKKPWRSGEHFIIVVQRQKGCKQWISIKIPIQVFPSHFSHEVAFYLIIVSFSCTLQPSLWPTMTPKFMCTEHRSPQKR